MKNFFAIAFLSLSILVGCTEKAGPVTVQEPDRRQTVTATGTKNSEAISPKVVLEGVYDLAPKVLSPERILDPASLVRRDVMDELIVFNRGILQTPMADRSQSRFQTLISQYAEALTVGCGQFSSSCSSALYFRLAGNSEAVLKLIIGQRPDLAGDVLPFALKLKPAQPDPELLAMTVLYGSQMVQAADPRQKEAIRSLLDTAILSLENSVQDPKTLKTILTSIHAWNLVISDTPSEGSTKEALFRMIAKSRLLFGDDGSLHPDLRRRLEISEARPRSLTSLQKKMSESRLFNPEAVGARPIEKQDELFFLVDYVFESQLTPDQAAELFLLSGRSSSDLADLLENYLRLRFSVGLFESAKKAVEIFATPLPMQKLLWYAIDSSAQFNQPWNDLEARLPSLKSFAAIALKGSSDPMASAREMKFARSIESYRESVKMSSTYPNTLLLFYILSQKQFKITIRGIGEIDSGDLFTLLFQSVIPPLLSYGEDYDPYSSFGLLYSFDMAVRSGLIESAGIDVDDFAAVIIRRVMEKPMRSVAGTLDKIENRFKEAPQMVALRRACLQIKSGTTYSRTIDLEGVRRSPYYGELIEDVFKGVSTAASSSGGDPGAVGKFDLGLNFLDSDFAESLELLRLNLGTYERMGQAMLTSYSDYLSRYQHLAPQEVQQKTVKLRAELTRIQELRERFLSDSRQWTSELGDCYNKIAIRDFKAISDAMEYEENYFRQVHRDIATLRGNPPEGVAQVIQQKYRFVGLPSNFSGWDRISTDGYLANQADFLIRAAGYIQHGLKTDTAVWPALAPHVTVNMGSKLNVDTPIFRRSVSKFIPFSEDEDEFVATAMRNVFSQMNPFSFWQNLTAGRLLTWTHYLKSFSSLYRIEYWMTKGRPVFVQPDRILETHRDMLRLVSLTPSERRLFKILAVPHRFDTLFFDNRLLNYTRTTTSGYAVQDYWGLFDLPVRVMGYDKIGYDFDMAQVASGDSHASMMDKRYGVWDLGQQYYNVRAKENRAATIFPFNAVLDQMLDQSMRHFVQSEVGAIGDFNKYAAQYAERMLSLPEGERPVVDLTMTRQIKGPMLSDSLLEALPAQVLRFNQSTAACLTTPSCPQFN